MKKMRQMSKKGFLLLEVMVSIVIITGGLLFVMRVYSTAREALDLSRTLFRHSLLLEDAMFEYDDKTRAETGKTEKEFSAEKGYCWEADVTPIMEGDAEDPDLNAIVMSVFREKKSFGKYSIATILRKGKK